MSRRNSSQTFYPVRIQARMNLSLEKVLAVKIIGIATTGLKVECSHSVHEGQAFSIEFFPLCNGVRERVSTKACVTFCNSIRENEIIELAFTSISKKSQSVLSSFIEEIKHRKGERASF